MNPKIRSHDRRSSAFSLVEVIAALVLAGVLAAAMLPLLQTGLTGNVRELAAHMERAYALRAEMDYWVHRYRTDFAHDLSGLSYEIRARAADEGNYQVSHAWILIEDGREVETGNHNDLLRVTISNGEGDQLTYIFSPQR